MTQFASTLYPQTNPTNPILLEFRRSAPWDIAAAARTEVPWLTGEHVFPIPRSASRAQVEHARRVLARLASLSG